ncbi:D-alanyl-D-alanine carboxypeptidase DacC precursor [Candidatus Arcanobacter lacustris]|jgi:D-alanyl-D-alanine carboxypeptidase|uniref:D-alanyl-D-alanine carboxypeptidase DacC n=1 Tax=Candidatus Arcanibacter lacustris TaxID=1607817 RepID=A0A0F5MMS0_9RICK|nr:D-alanyl-D-alanine carboxypeptidase DacC precursor [Candidatus Arcanobacter lacustris]
MRIVSLIILLILNVGISEANTKKIDNTLSSRHASLVVDYPSGNILHQENADKPRHPASLTKMMTIYLTFEAIKAGRLSFDQELLVSAHAAKTAYSSFVKMGQKIPVRDLVMASIVKSANDATVVLGEKLAGNEYEFSKMMTAKARQLNMHNTTFKNAHGLHHFEQKTTALDMAKLAIALHRDFPEYYHLFSKTSFVYKGKTYNGHNRVLSNYPGATGLKTGFINASGFNIVTTAKRNDATLIAVVMGGETSHARDNKTMRLLNLHFTGSEMVNEVSKLTTPATKRKQAKQKRVTKTRRSVKKR